MTNLTGQSLGRYHILEQLGKGGMATVYKAYDTRLETEVAVKVIRTENILPSTLERTLKRFEHEAKALARLTHPNIVKVMDYGKHKGEPYLVMPYLPGGTLKSKLNGNPMRWQDAVRILIPIANALEYAHKHDIIHRDVKPSNILITENGQPMLSDFGVAKLLVSEETLELTGTGIGIGIGTPEYMAPEQNTSKRVDARVDIYALGVVLYEMVTGRKPYIADTPLAVIIMHSRDPLPRPRSIAPSLPQEVENILLKALAKDPKDRYQNMAEFLNALEGLRESKATSKKQTPAKTPDRTVQSGQEKQREIILPFSSRTLKKIVLIMFGIGLIAIFSKWLRSLPSVLFPIYAATSTPLLINTQTETPSSNFTQTAALLPVFTSTAALIPNEINDKEDVPMHLVPAGQFRMGSDKGALDEQPVHTVYLGPYYIDKYEVTNSRYESCVNTGICDPPNGSDSYKRSSYYGNSEFAIYPVIHVDWYNAGTYCKWRGAELPTEAEWEKAARGTDGHIYPWGDNIDKTYANYNNSVGDTTAVGSYEIGKSPYGIYDMAGNVWEWVADWYDEKYYLKSPFKDPIGPNSGVYRVLRGGTWNGITIHMESSFRYEIDPNTIGNNIGFRCASTIAR